MGTLSPIRHLPFVDPGLPTSSGEVRGALGTVVRGLEVHHATGGLDPSLIDALRRTPPIGSALWLGAGPSSRSRFVRPKEASIRLAAATGVSSWVPVGEEPIPDRVEIDPLEVFCHYIELLEDGPSPFPLVMVPPISMEALATNRLILREAVQVVPVAPEIVDFAADAFLATIKASDRMEMRRVGAQLVGVPSEFGVLVDDPEAIQPLLESFIVQYRMLVRINQRLVEKGELPPWFRIKRGASRRLAGLEREAQLFIKRGSSPVVLRGSGFSLFSLDHGEVFYSEFNVGFSDIYLELPISLFGAFRHFVRMVAMEWAEKAMKAGNDFLRPLLVRVAQENVRTVRVLIEGLQETMVEVRRHFEALPQTLRDLEGVFGERLDFLENEVGQIEETARVDLRRAISRANILKEHLHLGGSTGKRKGPYLSLELLSLLLKTTPPSGADLADALCLMEPTQNQIDILEREGRIVRGDERQRQLDKRRSGRQSLREGMDEEAEVARALREAAVARELAERQALEEAAAMEGLLQGEAERLGAGARREEEIRARDRRLWIRLEEELSRLLTTLENDLLDEVGIERSSELEEDWIDWGGRTIYLRRARQEELERLRRRLDREFKRPLSEAADSEAVIASLRRLVNSVRDDTAFLHQRGRARE